MNKQLFCNLTVLFLSSKFNSVFHTPLTKKNWYQNNVKVHKAITCRSKEPYTLHLLAFEVLVCYHLEVDKGKLTVIANLEK